MPPHLPFEHAAAEVLTQSKSLLGKVVDRNILYADLFFESSTSGALRAVTQRANQVTPAFQQSVQEVTGLGLRAFNKTRQHITQVPDWAPAAWQNAAGELGSHFAPATIRNPDFVLPDTIRWGATPAEDAAHAVSREAQQHALAGMLDMVHAAPGVMRAQATLQYSLRHSLLVNTAGQAIGQHQAGFGVRLDLWHAAGSHVWGQMGFGAGFGTFAFEGGAQLVEEVLARSDRRMASRPVKAGTWPVVFAGGWAGLWLHETVGHLLEADVLPEHLKPGAQLGSKYLTVDDDPGLADARGSYVYDDEGNPGQRIRLVTDGKLERVLNDRFSARRRTEKATGHGRRMHYFHMPAPRMSNLMLAAGTASRDALVAEVREGLCVIQASAGRVDADTVTLHIKEGYWIEKGRFGYPVADVQITVSRFDLLKNLVGVGERVSGDHGTGVCDKAGQIVSVSMQTPAVLIDGLQVMQVAVKHAGNEQA